jgi:hypothetical protein
MTGTKTFCKHEASTKHSENRAYWNSQGSNSGSKPSYSKSGSSSSSSSGWGFSSGWSSSSSSSSSSYSTSSSSKKIDSAMRYIEFSDVELQGW